jgi:hypothetical protein
MSSSGAGLPLLLGDAEALSSFPRYRFCTSSTDKPASSARRLILHNQPRYRYPHQRRLRFQKRAAAAAAGFAAAATAGKVTKGKGGGSC